jgi:hypothetical protein
MTPSSHVPHTDLVGGAADRRSIAECYDWYLPPNGLALSCAAPIDRENDRAESGFQNASDLRTALWRQLQRRVGRQHGLGFPQAVPGRTQAGTAGTSSASDCRGPG